MANMAEASSTILFTLRSLTTLSNKLVHGRDAGSAVASSTALGALNTLLHSSDSQFVVFPPKYDLVTCADAKSFAKFCGNNYPPILVHPGARFLWHDNPPPKMPNIIAYDIYLQR